MSVEIYQGTYVSAESASNYIDVATITEGIRMLEQAANEYAEFGSKLMEISGSFTNEVLSVQGATMQNSIENCSSSITSVKDQLANIGNSIIEALQKALDKKQMELNEIAREKDQAAALQANSQYT